MSMKNLMRAAAVCGAATVIGVAGIQVASANLAAPQTPTGTTLDAANSGDGADVGPRGPRGKRGKPGPRGPQGPAGPQGPIGPASFPVSAVSTGGLQGNANDEDEGWRFYPAGNIDGDLLPDNITATQFGGFAVAPFAMTLTNFSLTRSSATPPGTNFAAVWEMVVDTDGPFTTTGRTVATCAVAANVPSCTLNVATLQIPAGATYWFHIPEDNGFGPGAYFSYILNRV